MRNYHNSNGTITSIGHITEIHPTKHDRNTCQKKFNEVLDIMAYEVTEEDKPHFAKFGASIKQAKFNVQI
eukprot:10946000-Ditylum_brightwellii.AAC.1